MNAPALDAPPERRLLTVHRELGYHLLVTLKYFKGSPYADIRQHVHDGVGGFTPVPGKGVAVHYGELRAVAAALLEASAAGGGR